jgi:uncharacterized protein (TIGR00266 family)
MDIQIKHGPSFALAIVKLAANEEVRTEPGAMVSHTDGMTTDTKAEGGLFGGLKRMVTGESFFQNTWKAPGQGGEITLAPRVLGDMQVLQVGSGDILLQSGAYVASEMGIKTDASWGGSRGFFGAGSLIMLRVSGQGKVLVASFGALEERVLAAGERYTVDTNHIVTMDASINFQIEKSGSWKSTILGGEGLVCKLTGPGRILMQTRSDEAFVGWLSAKLPSKSN